MTLRLFLILTILVATSCSTPNCKEKNSDQQHQIGEARASWIK